MRLHPELEAALREHRGESQPEDLVFKRFPRICNGATYLSKKSRLFVKTVAKTISRLKTEIARHFSQMASL